MSCFDHKPDIITRGKTEILETEDETGTGLKPMTLGFHNNKTYPNRQTKSDLMNF